MELNSIIQLSFQVGMVLYTLALICHLLSWRRGMFFFFIAGLFFNGGSLALRYYTFFPLLPLFQGPFFLPFVLGGTAVRSLLRRPDRPVLLLLMCGLSWATYLCPNDFYLPLLQFKTIFSHTFFIFGLIGKALFLLAGEAGAMLLLRPGNSEFAARINTMLLWGFFFWTLSVFSGAVWSWLGWGFPVVWDDAMIAISMAAWLLYALLLHLHLTRFSSNASRAWLSVAAAVWLIGFGFVPELGPFRVPGWLI